MSKQNQTESMVQLSISDGVAEIVLTAPHKLNSLDEQALADLSRAYDDAAAAGVRALGVGAEHEDLVRLERLDAGGRGCGHGARVRACWEEV